MEDKHRFILAAAAKKNFWLFCLFWDYEFYNDRRPFLYEIAEQFQRIATGEIERLSVSLPPRAGKSYITSLFCAWLIGRTPTGSVMRNSVTARLYNKFSRSVRNFIKTPKYRLVFPEVRMSDDNQGIESWSVDQAIQASYFGGGVGGTIIGEGANLAAITDDLYKGHQEAMSDTINEKTHFWYESEHTSRMEGDCPQIDIGTRWTKTDLIGKNTENKFYEVSIVVPALVNGETFCADVKSTKKYLELKDRTDEFIWNSEYMQEPIELEGTVFPHTLLNKYDELPLDGIDVCFADTADEGLDHYSCPFGRIVGRKVFIFDAVFNRYNLTQNEPIIISKLKEHKISQAWVEQNNAGSYHLRTLRTICEEENVDTYMRGVKNIRKKMLRILDESGFILKNFYFPKVSPSQEYDRFYKQLVSLLKTSSKEDDAADSLAGLCHQVRREFIR